MTEKRSEYKKESPFAAVTRAQWQATALSEWKGSPPVGINASSNDGITQKPYYDLDDAREITSFQLPVPGGEFLDARSWFNMPLISDADDRQANEKALEALNAGADGILFELTEQSKPDILLNGIEFTYCGLSFLAEPGHASFFRELHSLAELRKYDVTKIHGSIFWKGVEVRKRIMEHSLPKWVNFHRNGILSAEKEKISPSAIAQLLVDSVSVLENEIAAGASILDALQSVAFFVPAGADFFPSIARLKALRMLWYQIGKSYDPDFPGHAYIHVVSEPWCRDGLEPHSNLLKQTTAAMSAVLGGCDALTTLPERNSGVMLDRMAINVSSILREEAHFSKVADPVSGAYYLETLTDQVARAAWRAFQQLL